MKSKTSPLEEIMVSFPVQKGISDFYYSLTQKLREMKGVDSSVPIYSVGFCADTIFEHIVKYSQWWMSFSAAEHYEIGDMNVYLSHIWKGDSSSEGRIYRPSNFMVVDTHNNIARKGSGKYFFGETFNYDFLNPPKLIESESLLIDMSGNCKEFSDFVKDKLKSSK